MVYLPDFCFCSSLRKAVLTVSVLSLVLNTGVFLLSLHDLTFGIETAKMLAELMHMETSKTVLEYCTIAVCIISGIYIFVSLLLFLSFYQHLTVLCLPWMIWSVLSFGLSTGCMTAVVVFGRSELLWTCLVIAVSFLAAALWLYSVLVVLTFFTRSRTTQATPPCQHNRRSSQSDVLVALQNLVKERKLNHSPSTNVLIANQINC